MRILALWVDKYYSGSTSERFVKPLKQLGASIDVLPLEDGNAEAKLVSMAEKYDMLLHLPYPSTVRLEVIKALPIMKIAWCGDDEWYWHVHSKFAADIAYSHDYCITTYKPALRNYRHGILGSWGYSDDWTPKKTKKDIDIYFCGSKTPIRDQYIGALIDAGLKIVMDGPGYSGKVTLKAMIDRYRRAKIGLSFVSENKESFFYQQIKARTFEIPAVGTFQLSEYCDEIHNFFKNREEISTFHSTVQLVKKCKYFLKYEKERELIAERGWIRNKEYSYKNIFRKIFKAIEADYV